jgi:hypothetical protein
MAGVLILLLGLMPLLIGAYAFTLTRKRDEEGPDDPPPPPEPEAPEPILPPSLRRRDRPPSGPSSRQPRWRPPVRAR